MMMQQPQSEIPKNDSTDRTSLVVQQLHEGVTKELLYKEFKKYGTVKKLVHFPKNRTAMITFENSEEAAKAKRLLNHSKLLQKEIIIVNYQGKDSLRQQKKFNLFIKNVPETLETKVLHNFLTSKYGEVASLMLKKNEASDKNFGYGYVQFEQETDFNKIIEDQATEGRIAISNTEMFFNVEKFGDKKKPKTNKIYISGLFQFEVPESEKVEKLSQINKILEQIQAAIPEKKFSCHTEYNQSKMNFWTQIEFSYSSDEEEEDIYQSIIVAIREKFAYKDSDAGPCISYKANESSERNLLLFGIKNTVKEAVISEWIKKNIDVNVHAQNIRIKIKNINSTSSQSSAPIIPTSSYSATVFLESKKDGEKLMIFASRPHNQEVLSEIFEIRHKITLFLKKSEYEEIKKQTSKISDFYTSPSNFKQNQIQHNIEISNQMQFMNTAGPIMFPNAFQQHQMNTMHMRSMPNQHPKQNYTSGRIPPNRPVNAVSSSAVPPKIPQMQPQTPPVPQQSSNKFVEFQKLNPADKKLQVEDIAQKINTHKEEFEALDDNSKRAILGQIIYYKIQNLSACNISPSALKVASPSEAAELIQDFTQEVAKITGMLIDADVFVIDDIIEIVHSQAELIERCKEAIELIKSKN